MELTEHWCQLWTAPFKLPAKVHVRGGRIAIIINHQPFGPTLLQTSEHTSGGRVTSGRGAGPTVFGQKNNVGSTHVGKAAAAKLGH